MTCTLIHVLIALLASGVNGTQDLQGGTTQKAIEESNDQIERFLMENDKNWDRRRHCDWLIVTPNPQLVVKGPLDRTLIKLEAEEIYKVDKKRLFASSICLIIVTSAQNRDDLEQQVALGKNITFVIGKVAMIVMSDNKLDTYNMTKVPFPVMLMESDRLQPRDGMQYFFFFLRKK